MIRRSILHALAGVAALAAMAGCAPNTLPPPEGSAASASPTTGGPIDGTPERDPELWQNVAVDHGAVRYECNDGSTIIVRYPDTDHARVHYQGQDRPMRIAVSGSGSRYVGDRYEWWTHGGSEATLFMHADNGSTGDMITICHEQ
ncbi:MliC family protein [Salinisphaera sp.]|uniref:MliC family protein n=1 Tax=Salinisphaera sp. TaxID=1914330 RepID=UPI002D76F73C|nr:MliC family protein [Salinisphaera sp.]HET7314494.1 MliC family protein [Salinisphaera sp.]